jgi:membrane-bound serine protease (ClpP class)
LIDFVARDVEELCRDLDGFRVRRTAGGTATLALLHPRFEVVERSAIERTLGVVSEPQIASILFLIGLVGLYFEFSHPGAILPGVAGAVAMVLALYAFSLLPVNLAALGLIVLGLFFFIAEVKVSAHGMLALSGLLAFVAGFLLLFAGNRFGYRADVRVILPAAVLCAGTLAALSLRAAALRRRPASTGAEGLIGETGRALSDLAPGGKVMAHGEYWDAVAKAPVPAGSAVRIVGKEGFRLLVEKAEEREGGL